jgi:uncharacterized protein HemX
MANNQGGFPNGLKIILGVILLLFLFRLAGRLAFLLLIGLMIAGLGVGLYTLWNYYQNRRKAQKRALTVEGKAEVKIQHCDEQIEKNEKEAEQVKKSLIDLRKQMSEAESLSERKQAEATRLIGAFESELKLRQAKIAFFRAAREKLVQIQRSKMLDETISSKEEELRLLKEGHYEDLADMEALRSDMEMETLYLDTIDSLTVKTNQSKSMESVQSLQRELEEMTRGLKK